MDKTIYLAGGCFWGVQAYFERLNGVISTEVGYANGLTSFPTYEEVKSQTTGHAETVKIVYDDSLLPLTKLLEHFLRFVDPYSVNKQGNDEGSQYRSGVYYTDLLDAITADSYFSSVLKPGWKIEIKKMNNFYKAEEYHQHYLDKNPQGYCHVNLSLILDDEKKVIIKVS
jgi:methionine-S-sulfoxide reductase